MDNISVIPIESLQILDKCAEILVSAYNSEPWNDNWTQEKALEKLTCFYNSPKFFGWLAFQDDQLVGCCVGNVEPYFTGDYFYLKEMFISPALQGKGIGTRLLTTLKGHLETIDIKTIILFTGKDFFPFDFYLKHNFQEMEEMRMMHFGESE